MSNAGNYKVEVADQGIKEGKCSHCEHEPLELKMVIVPRTGSTDVWYCPKCDTYYKDGNIVYPMQMALHIINRSFRKDG